MDRTAALKRLFEPASIAFFGGRDAAAAIRQCRALKFTGEVFAINPNRDELADVPCLHSVDELPFAPDASFIAAPPEVTIDIVRALSRMGAGGAVCYAAGFAELGTDGAALQRALVEAAGDMPVVGPNCHGFVNYLANVSLWPDEHGGTPVSRGVAIVSQSGNIGINLSMQRRGLDLGLVITVGNAGCVGLHEYLRFLLHDKRITAIGLHIESIGNIHEFSEAAIEALRAGVPVVAIKTGRSARGAEINASHTAALATGDALYAALFERVGIARCDTVARFLETLKFVSTVGALPERTAGSMSCSGGEAALIADCATALDLDLPPLSAASTGQLGDVLGPRVPLSNPLDYHTYAWGNYEKLNACFEAVLSNRYACSMLVLDYPLAPDANLANWEVAERALTDAVANSGQRAVIVSTLPETMPSAVRERLKAAGITPMQGLEDCLFAISAAAGIGRALQRLERIQPVQSTQAISGTPALIDEAQSKAALAAIGISVPEGRTCAAEETVSAAAAIGFPVVVKALAPELLHKTEAGAVAVGLEDREAVARAVAMMAQRYDRFLVERMVGPPIAEVLVGISRDPTFGLTLTLGAGGTMTELLGDAATLLLPASREDIASALQQGKIGVLVEGHRGGARGDFDALVDAALAVAEYAMQNSATLAGLEINPLLVLADGVVAVDANLQKLKA